MDTARVPEVVSIPEATPATTAADPRKLGSALVGVAFAYLVAVALMTGFGAAAAPESRLAAQLASDRSLVLYRWGFAFASLLAPTLITMLVLLLAARGREAMRLRDWLGVVFLPMYATCSSIAYTSQYAVLPRLIEREALGAAAWYFQDDHSIPFALDLLGYTFLAIALTLLAFGFHARGGIWRWMGDTMLAVALTSLAAFVVLAAGAPKVAGIVSIVSAVLTVPLVALAIALGLRLRAVRKE